jgi:VanZ family protein
LKKVAAANKYFIMFRLWGPVLLQVALIFYFSAQPKGSPVLEDFPVPGGVGHFVGYFILGLLLYRAFNGALTGWSLKAGDYTFLSGLVYASSDELHQLFVPGRQCSFVDVVIDAAALIFALVVIRMWSLR